MKIRQDCEINNQFSKEEQTDENFEKKIQFLKLSNTDILFKNDIEEVLNDFEKYDLI